MRKTIVKNVSWQALGDVLTNVLGFVFYVIMARSLGQAGLGLYSYIFSIMAFLSLTVNFGFSSYYFRKWSGHSEEVSRDIWTILFSRLFILIPLSLGLFCYIFLLDRYASLEFLLAYLSVILELVSTIPIVFFNARNAFNKSLQINLVDKFASQGLAIVLLLQGFSLRWVLMALVLGKLLAILTARGFWKKLELPTLKLKYVRESLKESAPVFFFLFFNVVYFKVDVIVMRYMLGLKDVGMYSAAYRLFETLQIIPSTLAVAFTPAMVTLFKEKSLDKLNDLLNITITFLLYLASFICVFFSFYARDILFFLYGEKYIAAAPALAWLGAALALLYVNTVVVQMLYLQHYEKYLAKVVLGLTFVNIVLNSLFLPRFGVLGAGVVTFCCEFIKTVALTWKSGTLVSFRWPAQCVHLVVAIIIVWLVGRLPFGWPVILFISGLLYSGVEAALHWNYAKRLIFSKSLKL